MDKPIPFGKYFLLERINIGGMAEVFRAKQFGVEGFERLVAVKRILPNIAEDKDFTEMFVDEAKISVQLNHANIAQVFDLGHEDSSYYIALEHIHGRDLRAVFDRNRAKGEPMPVPQACFVIMKVCEGLDYAHNKKDDAGRELNLVHRDVSPQNVLVSFDGEVKIIDFGIAKAAGKGSQTQAGILKGKFGYMSPEQVRGLPVDRRSDVFSCGIVLYELLTGERLFVGESDFSTLEKVRNVEILPPSTYNRKIQPELERIVLKALAKDVEDRYQNAIDLHDELQAFVYTAGEFYSRKDLAAWMKQEWSAEIQEESAKIASYRDMVPPKQPNRSLTSPSTSAAKRKSAPPPIPGKAPVPAEAPAMAAQGGKADLDWDDDELETSIYDDEPDQIDIAAAQATAAPGGLPGMSVSEREPEVAPMVNPEWNTPTPSAPVPARVADGSNRMRAPATAGPDLLPASHRPNRRNNLLFGLIAVSMLIAGAIVTVVLIGQSRKGEDKAAVAEKKPSEAEPTNAETARENPGANDVHEPPAGVADRDTGIDLIVNPVGVEIRLDGRKVGKAPLQIRNLSAGEHFIEIEAPPGFFSKHETVTVEAGTAKRVEIRLDAMEIKGEFSAQPAGSSVVLLVDGEAQELGAAPATAELDPRKSYQVLFRLEGYESTTLPIEITGSPEVVVAAVLERSRRRASVTPPRTPTPAPTPAGVPERPSPAPAPTPTPDPPKPAPPKPAPVAATGTLMLGSKPPCKIFIDGRDTGKMTPQREIVLPVGPHRVTLINNELGVDSSFKVNIKADKPTRAIKDLTDQIRK